MDKQLKNEVLLPRSAKEFANLMKSLKTTFGVANSEMNQYQIATFLMHLPEEQTSVDLERLNKVIYRSQVSKCAWNKLEQLKAREKKRQQKKLDAGEL